MMVLLLAALAHGPVSDVFDLDGIADLIDDNAVALEVYFGVQAALLAFMIAVSVHRRIQRRSPVDRLVRRRFGV